MERDPNQVIKYIMAIEEQAEDILTDKQQLVDLDKRRQSTREAVRAMYKDKTNEKKWVCFGNMFIKLPKDKTKKLLDKDFDKLDTEISKTHSGLKEKVNKLRDLENQEEIKGFNLQPLSREEMKSIESVL